jgi:hypothetical protein
LTISQITRFCRWAKISAELGNRTDNDIKNRWHSQKRSAEKIRLKQEAFENVAREHTKSPGVVYHFDTNSTVPVECEYTQYNHDLQHISQDIFDEKGLQIGLSRTGRFNDDSDIPPLQYRNNSIESTVLDEIIIDRGLFGFATYAVSSSEQATAKQSKCGDPIKTKHDQVEAYDASTFPNPPRQSDLQLPQAFKPLKFDDWVNLSNVPLTTFTPTRFESYASTENSAARCAFKPQTDFQGYFHSVFSPIYGLDSMSSNDVFEEQV